MQYSARITREGKSWLAEFVDAPGCQTFATSEKKLTGAAIKALEGWLEAHLKSGRVPSRPHPAVIAKQGEQLLHVVVEPKLAAAVEVRWARVQADLYAATPRAK